MYSRLRRVALAVTAAAVFSAPALGLAATCSSAPSNANCTGKDPVAQGCASDPGLTEEAKVYYPDPATALAQGELVILYSPLCQSAWARTTAYSSQTSVNAKITRQSGGSFSGTAHGPSSVNTSLVFINGSDAVAAEGFLFKKNRNPQYLRASIDYIAVP